LFIGSDRMRAGGRECGADSCQANAQRLGRWLIGRFGSNQGRHLARTRTPEQSTDFRFSRFLVPWAGGLIRLQALFIRRRQCSGLAIIARALGPARDERLSRCKNCEHQHDCRQARKFQGHGPRRPHRAAKQTRSSGDSCFKLLPVAGHSDRGLVNTARPGVAPVHWHWRIARDRASCHRMENVLFFCLWGGGGGGVGSPLGRPQTQGIVH